MEEACPKLSLNLSRCGCTYEPCERRGKCCECVHYHRARGELPGCFFPAEAEKAYDRSVSFFVSIRASGSPR